MSDQCKLCGRPADDATIPPFPCGRCQSCHIMECRPGSGDHADGADRRLVITELGAAVVEAGLSVRQAHELSTGCSEYAPCEQCRRYL